MSMKRKSSIAVFVVVAFLAGAFFVTAGANVFDLGGALSENSRAEGTTELKAPDDLQSAFIEVADVVNPTVVQIQSSKEAKQRRRMPAPFRRFFGGPRGGEDEGQRPLRQGIGSGVIVRSNGYVVTNNHVVEDTEETTVVMEDGTQYDAEIVGADPMSDLAVLKVDETDLPTVSYGDSDNVQVGQWAMAFGSPLSKDLENTATAGIISAKGRVSRTTSNINQIAELIQTDVAINPGNSGGPLVNLQGELIGINSAIASKTGGYQGVGFAIPVNLVKSITDQLIESGNVARGYLGVSFGNVSPALVQDLDISRGAAQIERVQPGSAADDAGLQVGDIITAIEGSDLNNFNELRTTIGSKQPGDTVEMTIVSSQNGDRRTVEVELGERPDDVLASSDEPGGSQDGSPQGGSSSQKETMDDLGLSLQTVTPRLLQRQRIRPSEEYQGAFITNVESRSYAYQEAKLREGLIITHVGAKRVRSVEEFAAAYNEVEAGSTFRVSVLQVGRGPGGSTRTATSVTALRKPS
jgi:serine protease Do